MIHHEYVGGHMVVVPGVDRWQREPVVLERHGSRIVVARDDLLEGGSKLRFLPYLTYRDEELVFGGPCCGGAPLALSVLGKHTGQRVTLFYAKRKVLHPRQLAAQRNGAAIVEVPFGRISVVQKAAREYAAKAGARFLPLGFDHPEAQDPYVDVFKRVRQEIGPVDEVWCASGSGMLARCLGLGFPDAHVYGVIVGLRSRSARQVFPRNVRLLDPGVPFEREERLEPPFPSDPNYERKAWRMMTARSRAKRVLFWNVLGPSV